MASTLVGATIVRPDESLPSAVPPPALPRDIDPWALRDGHVAPEWRKAAADPDADVWRTLFAQWAVRRGAGKALHTPTIVAADRTARDALFDMLRIYDVYGARIVGAQHGLTLEQPSAVPADNDVSLIISYDPYNQQAARLTVHNGALLGDIDIHVEAQQLHDRPDPAVDMWQVRGSKVTQPGDGPKTHWIAIRWELDGRPVLHSSASVAALGRAFRIYAVSMQLMAGTTMDDVEHVLSICHGTSYVRAIPVPIAAREGSPRDGNLRYALARCINEGADGAARLKARVTVLFDLAAGTLEFDAVGSFLRGPGTAPAALFLDANEQWSRAHSPVLCSPLASTPASDAPIVPGAMPPDSARRQRFGHAARVVRHPATPLLLSDPRAYIAPAPLRAILPYRKRAAWLGLHLSELHPDAERVEATTTAHLAVGDFDRVLRAAGIDAIDVELVLGWRASAAQPLNFHTLPLCFQLVHADNATYAYPGMPNLVGAPRSTMPYAAHIVPAGY